MSDEAKLLPCPFCGGPAQENEAMGECWVGCANDECCGGQAMQARRERAIANWNTRADSAAKAQGAAEERARALAAIDAEAAYQRSLANEDNNDYAGCAVEVLARVKAAIGDHTKGTP